MTNKIKDASFYRKSLYQYYHIYFFFKTLFIDLQTAEKLFHLSCRQVFMETEDSTKNNHIGMKLKKETGDCYLRNSEMRHGLL